MTVLSLLALRQFGFTPLTYGILLTVFGTTMLGGASISPWLTARLGAGRLIIFARALYPLAWIIVATAPTDGVGTGALFLSLALQGLAMGAENSPEQFLWQTLTPDELLGRTSATRRAGNRTLAACGALLTGVVVSLVGERWTLVGVIVAFACAAVIASGSPLRRTTDDAGFPRR